MVNHKAVSYRHCCSTSIRYSSISQSVAHWTSTWTADNEGITFTGRPHTSPKMIANSFTISSLLLSWASTLHQGGLVRCRRMSLEEAESFTRDQVTSAINSCRSSRAYDPGALSIFHLKNLGPLATEHLTALYNDSLKSCRLPLIWKTPISHPDSQARQGLITRHLLQTHLAPMPSS